MNQETATAITASALFMCITTCSLSEDRIKIERMRIKASEIRSKSE